MITCGFLHSKEDVGLARAECECLFGHNNIKFYENLTIIDIAIETIQAKKEEFISNHSFSRLAFTKKIFLIHGVTSNIKNISGLLTPKTLGNKTVRLDYESLEGSKNVSANTIRKIVLSSWNYPVINLKKPDVHLVVFSFGNNYFLSELIYENKEDFESRKNHNYPAPHPTSSHPKLLRAMINLTSSKTEIIDPFCGSGGFLIEAILMGLKATGIDINSDMLTRAEKNLKYLGLNANLVLGDALDWNKNSCCVVTDLPYGLNSKSSDLNTLYLNFLKKFSELTNKIVVCFPSLVDHKKLVIDSGLKVTYYFNWRIHKSLTKHIYLLESNIT